MIATTSKPFVSTSGEAFAAWAPVYDARDNPMLLLEERYLTRMLPYVDCKRILDAGCGTGRWLEHLTRLGTPTSLHGVDASPEMLQVARTRQLANTILSLSELPELPVPSHSIDLALASFVLSYLDDIEECARELCRIVSGDGDVFITDIHPVTATALGWSRGFRDQRREYILETTNRSLAQISATMLANGFVLAAECEACFGETEADLFRRNGKSKNWAEVAGKPAIYLLHFRRARQTVATSLPSALNLRNAHCAIGPEELTSVDLHLAHGHIQSLTHGPTEPSTHANDIADIDLQGYTLFPGLVNAHDHLEFALFPRLGSRRYGNASEWALDIQTREADTIALQKQIPKSDRLWWGAIRNLLSGVTTVCHHNPIEPPLSNSDFHIRVISQFGWEHSPAFARDIPLALSRTGPDEPFIIHACEGTDQAAAGDLQALHSLGALEERSVLVHGLALQDEDIRHLNRCGASLIVCPSSNNFLFGACHTLEQLRSVTRLALGSDSPLTANGDLLDEIRFTQQKIGLSTQELYAMVTDRPAKILRLRAGQGTLRPTIPADIFAMRSDSKTTPSDQLASSSWRDVELVIVDGRVRLASSAVVHRLPERTQRTLNPLLVDGVIRWLAAPIAQLLRTASNVLGEGSVRLGGLPVSSMER